ncbi:MAG: DNA replication/repair protein RecF [Wolbachia endosymbiont of Fragariocoptes setiger]|nr:DNA replication/repair protein RecF [Wolbachia endosymbiont of Fragariocoptes setiger]
MFNHCYIQNIKLNNFRNYSRFDLNIGNNSIVITGKNGVGKTNILEAASLLAKSNGMRKARTSEMQNKFTDEDWAIHYTFFDGKDLNSIGIAKNLNKKLVQVNGKVHSSLYELSNVIWFTPQMDNSLLKSPSDRLKFLDRIVSMFEGNYVNNYMKYQKAKYERSKLLKNGNSDENWLSSLEKIMITSGISVTSMRLSAVKMLQDTVNNHSNSFFPKANLQISSQLESNNTVDYYQKLLKKNRAKDLLLNRVNFGSHNDNFQIFCQKRSIPINLCSTGEQKLILLSIILSSVRARYLYYNKLPVLLLDDVMSYLDDKHRNLLIEEVLSIQCQTWITDVNKSNFDDYRNNFEFFNLTN